MKNSVIFSFVRVSDNSMVASVRIARWLSEYLDVPLVWDQSIGDKRSLNTLIIVNGAYGFSKHLEALSHAILGARRIVWVQNDYTIIPPRDEGEAQSPFRRAFVLRKQQGKMPVSFWSTCHKWSTLPGSHYVNWNMLTFDPDYSPRKIAKRRLFSTNTLLYYGSFREDRVKIFDRYFSEPCVDTVLSSPVKKFEERYPKCEHVPAILENFYETLGGHGLGLYVEDRRSSREFHSPANRFYEMLSAGLPMVFQPECGTMLRKAGYDPTPWVANNPKEIARHMEQREKIGAAQREQWAELISPKNALIEQVEAARRTLG